MSDLISRQDAIEALDFEIVHMSEFLNGKDVGNPLVQYNKGLEDGIEALKALPSAEPEQKWIPVSEALPEDMDRVLVTIRRRDKEMRVRSGDYYKGYFMMDNGDTWNETDKEILAWMPLPEPYKEGE